LPQQKLYGEGEITERDSTLTLELPARSGLVLG